MKMKLQNMELESPSHISLKISVVFVLIRKVLMSIKIDVDVLPLASENLICLNLKGTAK